MAIERWASIGIATFLLALSLRGAAHHGQVGLFDESRTVELSGSVKEWSFVNPHPVLVLDVAEANDGTVAWDVYFGPSAVSALRRRGFSADTFRPGETVIVKGHVAVAEGAHGIDVWGPDCSVTRADGAPIP
jgi:hypothetical protein